jgi:hypothetical protein
LDKAALKLCATDEEIMEVLKPCVAPATSPCQFSRKNWSEDRRGEKHEGTQREC